MQLWPAFHLCWVCKPVRQTTERIQILYIEISGLKYTAALPSNLGGYIRYIYIHLHILHDKKKSLHIDTMSLMQKPVYKCLKLEKASRSK